MKRITLFVILISGILATSCDRNRIYEKYKSVENHQWYFKDTIIHEVDFIDTAGTYSLYINMRNKANYPYRNIWLGIAGIGPEGEKIAMKKEFKLADKKGKWKGQGLGDVYDHRFLLEQKFKIENPGVHQFRVNHLMRKDTLQGMMDVGLRVEKNR